MKLSQHDGIEQRFRINAQLIVKNKSTTLSCISCVVCHYKIVIYLFI